LQKRVRLLRRQRGYDFRVRESKGQRVRVKNFDSKKGRFIMDKVTIVLQDAPYGNEKVWNALRLTQALLSVGMGVRIFLYGDSVIAAKKGQSTPTGFYNIGDMMAEIIKKGADVRACLTCANARGVKQEDFIAGAVIGKTLDLAHWIKEGGQVMVF